MSKSISEKTKITVVFTHTMVVDNDDLPFYQDCVQKGAETELREALEGFDEKTITMKTESL